jgi:hypothetical protein
MCKVLQKHHLTVEINLESICSQKPQSSFLTMLDIDLFTQLMTFLYVLHSTKCLKFKYNHCLELTFPRTHIQEQIHILWGLRLI